MHMNLLRKFFFQLPLCKTNSGLTCTIPAFSSWWLWHFHSIREFRQNDFLPESLALLSRWSKNRKRIKLRNSLCPQEVKFAIFQYGLENVHQSLVSFSSLLCLHWKLCHLFVVYHTGLSHWWGWVCDRRLRWELGLRRSRHMAHSSFLLRWYFSGSAVCLSELFCTVIERPKELTHITLASGILGKLNKSRRHLLSPLP